MHRDNFAAAQWRATCNVQLVYQVIAATPATPMAAGDILARLPIEPTSVYSALKHLRRAGVLRYVQGSKRKYELVPGVERPQDGRGKAAGSRSALERVARLRSIASRPLSQLTAAVPLARRIRAQVRRMKVRP